MEHKKRVKGMKRVKLQVVATEADYDPARVLGKELFPELYANILIAGKKKSGKTQLLYNVLKRCARKKTKVILFGATVNKDATYKEIVKMLDRKGIEHVEYEHFIDPDTGENLIDGFIKKSGNMGEFCEPEEDNDDEEGRGNKPAPIPKEKCKVLFGGERTAAEIEEAAKKEEEKEKTASKKPKKVKKGPKVLAPEYILCFDDLGKDLRNKSVSQLLIKNRHFKCKTIILSQWLTFLDANARRQLDYCILFGGFSQEKLEELHQELDLSDTPEQFITEYKKATDEKYSFLYIDVTKGEYRTRFDNARAAEKVAVENL